jgi:hypothetical protein
MSGCDAVNGSSANIEMRHIIGSSHEPPMPPSGTKREFNPER